ncbi:hypothetical protein V6N13_077823 [Hibiscus sabdariffa]
MGNKSCYDMNEFKRPTDETYIGWKWQTCSEMVMPIGHGNNDSIFPPEPFNLNVFIKKCKSLFGVQPRPHWVTTYYGGHDLKLILHRFGSNIIDEFYLITGYWRTYQIVLLQSIQSKDLIAEI